MVGRPGPGRSHPAVEHDAGREFLASIPDRLPRQARCRRDQRITAETDSARFDRGAQSSCPLIEQVSDRRVLRHDHRLKFSVRASSPAWIKQRNLSRRPFLSRRGHRARRRRRRDEPQEACDNFANGRNRAALCRRKGSAPYPVSGRRALTLRPDEWEHLAPMACIMVGGRWVGRSVSLLALVVPMPRSGPPISQSFLCRAT